MRLELDNLLVSDGIPKGGGRVKRQNPEPKVWRFDGLTNLRPACNIQDAKDVLRYQKKTMAIVKNGKRSWKCRNECPFGKRSTIDVLRTRLAWMGNTSPFLELGLEWMVIRFVTQNLCGCKQVGLHSQDFYRGMLLFNKSCGDMGRFENMETSFSRLHLHNKVLVTSACDGGFKDEREWSIDAGLLSIVQRSLHSTVAIYAVYMASHTGLFISSKMHFRHH